MANYYTTIVATETLKCSEEQYERLQEVLEDDSVTAFSHGFVVELCEDNRLYITAEDNGDPDALPEQFLQEIGKLLQEQGSPYLEFAMSFTCSKLRQDGFGGGYFRITSQGKLVFPELVWPKE